MWVHPGENWQAKIASIPNDGNDYEIVFDPGEYLVTSLALNHSAGGQITLRGHVAGQAVLLATDGVCTLGIAASTISIDKLTFGGPVNLVTGPTVPVQRLAVYLGTALAVSASTLVPASTVTIRNCTVRGDTQVFLLASAQAYSTFTVEDLAVDRPARNGALVVRADNAATAPYPLVVGTGLKANVMIRRLHATGWNGPDGLNRGGVGASNLSNGMAALDFYDFGYNSTVTVQDMVWRGELHGSLNHDLHAYRVSSIRNSNVRFLFQDCDLQGKWENGYATGDGGGNLWLGYLHSGGPPWPEAKPIIRHENVWFETYVGDGVPVDYPPRYHFQCGSSGKFEFWDCHFSWRLPAFLQNNVWAVRPVHQHATVEFHSCEQVGVLRPPTDSEMGVPDVNRNVYYEDSSSLLWGPTRWRRR